MDQPQIQKIKLPSSEGKGDGNGGSVEITKKEDEIKETSEFQDLCITCNNAPLCTSRKNFIRPVYFCEEFDDYVPQKKRKEYQIDLSSSESKAGPSKEETRPSMNLGLCVNCAHNESCKYPKLEGGIWHCEEYE